MSAFALLSAPLRSLLALWTLLLCLADLGSVALAAVKRRFPFAGLALLLLAPAYLLWQVIFDLSLFGPTPAAVPLSLRLGALPWSCWLAACAGLSFASALLLAHNLRVDRTSMTPGAIKLFLDRFPCGVCCWRKNGRVLFSNECMNALSLALTGRPLLNGNQLREATAAGILPVDGKVWRFSCREKRLDGETLHEMIASDLSSEYAKTQALERDRAELAQLNRRLRDYYRSMDDIVRRQEILQAKAKIHDEMNRLMLSSTAADPEDAAGLDRIFALWEQNALLLGFAAEDAAEAKAAEDLEKLAAALNVRLIRPETLPDALSEAQRALLLSAAREALANAVKHAGASTLRIDFDETETELRCRFTNDGRPPQGPVRFTGGLANLALLAEKQGARVAAEAEEAFTLLLCFPKPRDPT